MFCMTGKFRVILCLKESSEIRIQFVSVVSL